MNFLDLLRTAVSNTFRSKLRTTLTVIAIFIGAFTITLTSAIGTGVSNYIDSQVSSIGDDGTLVVTKAVDSTSTDSGPAKYDPEASGQSVDRGPASFSYLSQSDVDDIEKTDGIESLRPAVALAPKYAEYGDQGKYVVSLTANAGEPRRRPGERRAARRRDRRRPGDAADRLPEEHGSRQRLGRRRQGASRSPSTTTRASRTRSPPPSSGCRTSRCSAAVPGRTPH